MENHDGEGNPVQYLRNYARNRLYDGFDRERESTWQGPFTFIASADTQYGLISRWDNPNSLDWEEEVQLSRQGIDKINMMKPRPRFVVVLGDLVDAKPGSPGNTEQQASFIKENLKLDPEIRLVCLPGNHDTGDSPSLTDLKTYTDVFGDDYYSFWVGGVRFIVINSQFYADASNCREAMVEQEAWLDKQLEEVQHSDLKHTVILQHIPWFLKSPDEDHDYFNVEKQKRLEILNKFEQAGVSIIFCGHYHRSAGGFYRGMEEVVVSAWGKALGGEKSGMAVVKVTEDSITHKFYSLDEFPLECQ